LLLKARGFGQFDDARLIHALAMPPLDEQTWCAMDAALLQDYNQFYGLQFDGIDHHLALIESTGERITLQAFVPNDREIRAWALVCHGYYDHVGLYGHLISDLLERDIAVMSFDQPGHGLSTGDRANIGDFQQYVDVIHVVHKFAAKSASEKPLHWFGQSMGGALVMEYWQQQADAKPTGEVVLLAPLVRPYAWPIMRWVFALANRTVAARPRNMTTNMLNKEFVNLLAADPLQADVLPVAWVQAMINWFTQFEKSPLSSLPVNIVQGYEDRTVSFRHNLGLLNRHFKNAAIHIIPKARHHLVNETPDIYAEIWAWLEDTCDWYNVKS
jgi:alpha-beta hydrolase superfamily lysophospholipase